MKRILIFLAVGPCLALAIFANAIWWIMHPDTPLNFSNPVWNWLVSVYGVKTAYQKSDLAFLVSSAGIVLGFAAAILIFRRRRDAEKRR
ncbi:hypothetical protein GXB81_29025 [Paraburkholderia sp. Ac-20336]|uniref:hypothetical protein n=1 Tax=unclassified Paraburkholderia TaxID=2615204 RepID=UPI00142477D3|nr:MULTISPECIES: hypothetical protein [unclassified Paraburkholderia]MBN3807052.1 hypothetical protein [Paraburkholderia sp. Ac-20336]NIF77252.1 hypothetical protein [Paraburkholderia sp. Cy-641]